MINDLKEFEKFLKICRKQGVTEVALQGVSVKLGDLPNKHQEETEEVPTDSLSEDELMFYHLKNATPDVNQ